MFTAALAQPTLEGGIRHGVYLPGLLTTAVCLLVLLLVALPALASWRRGRGRHVLGPAAVESLMLGAGALVVDLREEPAYRAGHIRGCLHVPFGAVAIRFATPDPKAIRPLILVDETDKLSHRAYELLIRRGFEGIYVLKGGMRAWRQANRPLAR